ncbi:microtubule-associated protein 9 isoform X2 [Ambystoma mexicanum]|uniref:microtubule-associated protein 9 isoform X2 n=1 Tax=Ambystoma mexicanum TaxID=8296 RepID=UPI0037E89E4C
MSDDENASTTLAYIKNPKSSRRTSFQDELQKAVNARISSQPTIKESEYSDYSDEFNESDDDDDGILKKHFNTKATSGRMKSTISKDFLLSDDEEETPKKISFLKNKKLIESYDSYEWENKNNENTKQTTQDFWPENGKPNSSFFSEDQKENQSTNHNEGGTKPVPIPKPRDHRIRSSRSDEGLVLSDESFKPTPLQRNILRKGNHVEESRTDERSSSSRSSSSLSAPSSLTMLNDKSSEDKALLENFSPEGCRQNSPPLPTPKLKSGLSLTENSPGDSMLTVSPEGTFSSMKGAYIHKDTSHGKDDGRNSPSVLELMMATVYEQSKQQLIENTPPEREFDSYMSSKARHKVEQEFVDSSGQEAEPENTFERHRNTIQERNLKNKDEPPEKVNPPSTRSLNTTPQQAKKSSSTKSNTYNTAKSRYLGTLTVLDNKQLLKNASDPEGADTLRAAVYQDWLEKKKVFLQELQKIKKTEEEKEREKRRIEGGAKKEEASASFQAWKAEKTKELKKNMLKVKEEEEKKRKELEHMAEKKEESKKAFERWREDKEEHLKEKIRKEKQAEMAKKRKEQQSVVEKKKENTMAFSKWAERKEDFIKSKKKEKTQEKEKQEKERAEKEWQEKKAMEEYERWLEKKERNDKIVKKQKKLQVILEDEPIPPWSPPGRTVPMGK